MTLIQKRLKLVGWRWRCTCSLQKTVARHITFLQVPLHTDSDSLHREHFDSWSLTRTPKCYTLRNRPKRQSMPPEPYHLNIREWKNRWRESGRIQESIWPVWPDRQAGDSMLMDCQYFAEGKIWRVSFRMFLSSKGESIKVTSWLSKVVEASVNLFFLKGRWG